MTNVNIPINQGLGTKEDTTIIYIVSKMKTIGKVNAIQLQYMYWISMELFI